MKKRIFFVITLLAVSLFVLSACPNNSFNITRVWDIKPDVFEYNAYNDKDQKIGEMSVYMTRIKNQDTEWAGETVKGFTGHSAGYSIELDGEIGGKNAAVSIQSAVLFGDDFKPLYSYKSVIEDGVLIYEIKASYAKKYSYTIKKGQESESGTLKLSGTYYDNEMVFALLRSCPLEEKGDSLSHSFAVPSVLDSSTKLVSMKITRDKSVDYSVSEGKSAWAYKYAATNGDSSAMTVWCAKSSNYKLDGRETFIPVMVKQGGVIYY